MGKSFTGGIIYWNIKSTAKETLRRENAVKIMTVHQRRIHELRTKLEMVNQIVKVKTTITPAAQQQRLETL